MHHFLGLILTLAVVGIQADLVCLGWSLISPVVGVICHFAPDKFRTAENATVKAVDEAVQSAKHLAQFDLTHNPVAVTYNLIEQTNQGGLAQGGQYLKNVTIDFREVTTGFAKESANQVVQLYDLTHWNDVSFCLIRGAARLGLQAKGRSGKRAGLPSGGDAVAMANACISDKFKQIAKPAVFNLDGLDQQVGATISDIATLFVPITVDGEAAVGASKGLVDLAIPGSEDATRMLKKVGDKGDHFANEAEAQAVADKLQDKDWAKENCAVCIPPSPAGVITARHFRRGNVLTSCCSVPAVVPPHPEGDFDEGYSMDADDEETQTEQSSASVYDPTKYNSIGEGDLVAAPEYKLRDVTIPGDVYHLKVDLNTLDTGVIAWSPELTAVKSLDGRIAITSSDDLFAIVRKIFTSPKDDPLYSALEVWERDGNLRLQFDSGKWLKKKDLILRPLQDWTKAAIKQAVGTVGTIKGMSAEEQQTIDGSIEFFYTRPSQEALAGVDPRGFHVDAGMMQFACADTPGLIIRGEALKSASRVPVRKNAFQLTKGWSWDTDAWFKGEPGGPTYHTVFGPEMAQNGRVSMVLSVFRKGSFI